MWFSIGISIAALLGMTVLVVLKVKELAGKEMALLRTLRRIDPYVENGWRTVESRLSVRLEEWCRKGYGVCKGRLHIAGVAAHARLHTASVRFGEYLKKQGVAVPAHPVSASLYLKGMLEYKQRVQTSDALADTRGFTPPSGGASAE